jgi:hypothetical protein
VLLTFAQMEEPMERGGTFAELSRIVFSLIDRFYSTAAGKAISTSPVVVVFFSIVVAHQPFGDLLRFSPEFHVSILDAGDHHARRARLRAERKLAAQAARAPC